MEKIINVPMIGGLSFEQLRTANLARLPLFKDANGNIVHNEADGSDWSLGDWCTAVTGELGEAANILKKIRRGEFTLEEAQPELAKELADTQIYLDILAYRAGINLGNCVISKFNGVSWKKNIPVTFKLSY